MSTWKRIIVACLSLLVLGLAPAGAALAQQIKVTAATPSSAYQGTVALDVVVSGSGFNSSAKVQYFVSGTTNTGGITVRSVRFNSSKQLVTTIDVADTADLASFDIVVTLSDGRKGKGTTLFSVQAKSSATDSFVGENLGTLPGAKQSDAWDVNAAGRVVGRSYLPMKGFYWDGTMHELAGSATGRNTPPFTVAWEVEATAISNGPAEVAVGYEDRTICTSQTEPCDRYSYPVVWTGDLRTGPDAVRLDAAKGSAMGINAAGTMVVGACGGGAGAFWKPEAGGWSRSNIPLSAFVCEGCVYGSGVGWDVNAAGIIVGSVDRTDDYRQLAYFYDTQATRGMILPIPQGFAQSQAFAVGNVIDGRVQVAGWIASCADMSCATERGIRWTVDVASQVASYEVLDQMAWAEGVTDLGFVAGTNNSSSSRRGSIVQTAVIWKQSVGYVQLKPPSGSDSTSRSMAAGSDGTLYVVGVSNSKGVWTAARWVIP